MGYELHLVKTKDWSAARTNPLSKIEVEVMVAADPELECFEADFQEAMTTDTHELIRVMTPGYLFIRWNGQTRFWWKDGEIICKSPQPHEVVKFVRLARVLAAYVVGDEGEVYDLKRSFFFGKETLRYTDPEGRYHPC